MENLLIAVDQIIEFMAGCSARALISAILTKSHLQLGSVNQVCDWSFIAFHRFTALITTTSLISLKIIEVSCFDDWLCGFRRSNLGAKFRTETNVFPTYFHSSGARCRLYTFRKSE